MFTNILRRSCAWFCVLGIALAHSSEWPQFRGPNGSGIAPEDAQPPTDWSNTHHLKWSIDLPGPGSSSPIVSGGRLFVTCYTGYGVGKTGGPDQLKRHLIAVEPATGKILWDQVVAAVLPEDPYSGFLTEHGYATSTPVADGNQVFVFYGKTGALAYDFSGKQLWKVNLGKQSSNRRWGSGTSPMLYENMVIVNAADESRSVRALDKKDGHELWKAEADSLELCFGTPIVSEGHDGRTDLVLAVPGEIWGMNPHTGKLRWFAKTLLDGNVSPTVAVSDGTLFTTGGFPKIGTVAVRAGGTDDVSSTNLLWSVPSGSYVPSPIVKGDNLYMVTDQGFAICLDSKSGKTIYKERLPGVSGGSGAGKPFYASPVLAHGALYAVSRRNGVFVIDASQKFRLIAHNPALDESDFNGTAAICGNQMFLRSNRALYCIEQPGGSN